MRQPFAQVALVDAGRGGKLGHRHRTAGMQGLVQPQRVTDAHQRDARRTAEIGQHLPDELMQFGFVHVPHLPS